MAAGEGEQLRDAAVGERAGDELAAVDRAVLGARRRPRRGRSPRSSPSLARLSEPMSPPAPGRVLFAASLGFFVVILDVTIVNVALPSIGDDLGADLSELQWVVDAYVVAFAALLLSAGAFGDRIGVARCYSAGMVAFTLASIVCGAAPSLEVLLVARFLQGAAAALLLPSSPRARPARLRRPGRAGEGDRDLGGDGRGRARRRAGGRRRCSPARSTGGRSSCSTSRSGSPRWSRTRARRARRGSAPRSTSRARSPRSLAVGALTYGVIEAGHQGIDSPAALAAFVGLRARRRGVPGDRAPLVPPRRAARPVPGPDRERRDRHRPAVQLRLLRPGLRPQPLLPGRARPRPDRQRADVPAAHRPDRRGQRLVGRARQPPRAATADDRGPCC